MIGRCYYWSHTSARSVRLYTGECVVDSSMGLWDRARCCLQSVHFNCLGVVFIPELFMCDCKIYSKKNRKLRTAANENSTGPYEANIGASEAYENLSRKALENQ